MTQGTTTATRINPDALLTLPPAAFIAAVAEDPTVLDDPRLRARDTALRANSSVCSYCGVGCPYTVEPDAQGSPKIFPLSDLGLCVKGKTSLMTGSDQERVKRLARRGIADDRIRAPMLRGHDGKMREVTWDEALDRAAWLFLHAREWVGPDAVAIYGNGQKTIEAIWMASLYKLVFRLPTIGANSEHCLTSAGAAHQLNFGNEASFTWRQFDELLECDVAVMHGTNAYVTFPQAYEKIKRNTRAVKVVIDPVRSDTVSDLQDDDPRTLHVRFRQGGDVKFNLAVARVIFDNGWEDRDSIQARVDPESEAAFRALCAQDRFRPEDAADSIALPGQDVAELAAMIRRYAELIAKPREGHRPRVAEPHPHRVQIWLDRDIADVRGRNFEHGNARSPQPGHECNIVRVGTRQDHERAACTHTPPPCAGRSAASATRSNSSARLATASAGPVAVTVYHP